MLKRWLILLICGLVSMSSYAQNDPILKDTHNHSTSLSELKGKWVIVNYWAEWCHTCMDEVPEFNRFYRHNHDKNIVLYGVNYDQESFADLQNTVKNVGVEFPVLANNPANIWHFDDVNAVPTTFIVNPKGKVVETITGGTTENTLNSIMRVLQKDYEKNKV